jgi:AraC-like DNA-binding protein
MHAHFVRHVYHRHSHGGYSFGVTDDGVQTFRCRRAAHASGAGMVMAFNPEDPHDGRARDGMGFTYRMVHIGPALIASVLADIAPGRAGLPLFTEPVISDPVLAARLRDLHRALLGGASRLRRDEALTAAVGAMVMRAGSPASAGAVIGDQVPSDALAVARHAREILRDGYRADLTAADLSHATGRSRFAVHRAFTSVYGLAPSDYQRQLRLRAARQLIAAGRPIAAAAAEDGFADQSHLTRWFTRTYGITPGCYQRSSAA